MAGGKEIIMAKKRMGVYNRGVNGMKKNNVAAKSMDKPASFNDKLSLKELLTLVSSTKGVAIPTRKALKATFEPIAVYVTRNYQVSIYQNGFALGESWKRHSVFRVDACKDYHYDTEHETLAKQKNSATKPDITFEEFLDEPWPIRISLTAGDKLEENNDTAARRAISEHPAIASDVQQYNRYVHGESVENQVIWKMSTLEALSTLTERQQEAMLLYYVEGYTQQEIGRMLGISTTAVKNRLESGLQRIRKHIYAMMG